VKRILLHVGVGAVMAALLWWLVDEIDVYVGGQMGLGVLQDTAVLFLLIPAVALAIWVLALLPTAAWSGTILILVGILIGRYGTDVVPDELTLIILRGAYSPAMYLAAGAFLAIGVIGTYPAIRGKTFGA
jgi:hypothetical protein